MINWCGKLRVNSGKNVIGGSKGVERDSKIGRRMRNNVVSFW